MRSSWWDLPPLTRTIWRSWTAIDQCGKILDLDPNSFPALRYRGLAYEQKGMYSQAIAQFKKSILLMAPGESTLSKAGLGHVYGVSGKKTDAQNILEELTRLSAEEYVPGTSIALIYAGLGEKNQAFTWLDKGYEQRAFQLQWIQLDPRWDSLHSDPRFQNLLLRINLTQQ